VALPVAVELTELGQMFPLVPLHLHVQHREVYKDNVGLSTLVYLIAVVPLHLHVSQTVAVQLRLFVFLIAVVQVHQMPVYLIAVVQEAQTPVFLIAVAQLLTHVSQIAVVQGVQINPKQELEHAQVALVQIHVHVGHIQAGLMLLHVLQNLMHAVLQGNAKPLIHVLLVHGQAGQMFYHAQQNLIVAEQLRNAKQYLAAYVNHIQAGQMFHHVVLLQAQAVAQES